MSKKLYGTLGMYENDKEQWLELRKGGIGGSEIGSIAGVNKWSSPLEVFVKKTMTVLQDEDNNAMKWGRILESVIAKQFEIESEELTGYKFKVRRDNFVYAHDDYDFLRASIDRRMYNDELGMGILEVKTTRGYYMDEWADEQIPVSYECQLMWYMGIMGASYGYIVALVGGQNLEIRRLEFDQEMFDSLVKIGIMFWEECILKNTMPAPQGNESEVDVIKKLTVGFDPTNVIVDESEETAKIISARFVSKEIMEENAKIKRAMENKLRLLIDKEEVLNTKEYRVTYKPNKNGVRSLRFSKRKDV